MRSATWTRCIGGTDRWIFVADASLPGGSYNTFNLVRYEHHVACHLLQDRVSKS